MTLSKNWFVRVAAMIFSVVIIFGIYTANVQPASAAPANTMTVTNKSSGAQTNYPLQFARPFMQGEIANYPQVLVNGVAVTTQADVKQRYSDGSVKHAIISLIIPSIPASGALTLTFQNQSTGNNTPLTKAEMLGSNYNFDATISATFANGTTGSASARAMLSAAADCTSDPQTSPTKLCTTWTSGPVATTIVLADNSTSRAYDFGSDGNRSIRPIFHVTFWRDINKVEIRFIGDDTNTETLKTEQYSFVLKTGMSNQITSYTQPLSYQHYATRWTRTDWIGGAPEQKINVDHNLAYLKETKFFPNYDTSLVIPESTIASAYSDWLTTNRNIYGNGRWTPAMGTTGGRGDIGPYPDWVVRWFYTGDWRTFEIASGHADLAGNWGIQVREGDSTKTIYGAFASRPQHSDQPSVSALGRAASTYSRPTLWVFDGRATPSTQDAIDLLPGTFWTRSDCIWEIGRKSPQLSSCEAANGPNNTCLRDLALASPEYPGCKAQEDGWIIDAAHQPDPYSALYTLTGDYWYLEQAQIWAAFFTMAYNPGGCSYCGGQYLGFAGIKDQVRGDAWAIRNRVNAAFLTPDNVPEKGLFTDYVNDALAIWEATYHGELANPALSGHEAYQWQKQFAISGNPLRFWERNTGTLQGLDTTKVAAGVSGWMQNFLVLEIGIAKERGFAAGPLLSWISPWILGQVDDPAYDPHLITTYRTPVAPVGNVPLYFTAWSQVKDGFTPEIRAIAPTDFVNNLNDTTHGYGNIARAAISVAAQEPGGAMAWSWIKTNGYDTYLSLLSQNPKWAILPRTLNSAPLPATTAPPVALDTTLPNISLSAPTGGTISGSSVVVSATASDNVGVSGVQFKLDGSNLGSEDTSAPYSMTWNSTTATNDTHSLTAVARDAAGNTKTSAAVSVTTSNATITPPPPPPTTNAPTATISASQSSITAGQSTTITWSSTNTTSCTTTNFNGGGAVSGSVSVIPSETTTYGINCIGAGGSVARNVTVTVSPVNVPTTSFSITSVTTTGDFTTSNNCSSLSSGASCTISVLFKPTATGLRTGTLTIVDSIGVTRSVALSGSGVADTTTSPPTTTGGTASGVTSGLVSYWPMDGNVNDTVGPRTGASYGGATFTAGKFGQALQLDGVTGYVDAKQNQEIQAQPYTVSFWFKTSALPSSNKTLFNGGRDGACIFQPDVFLKPDGRLLLSVSTTKNCEGMQEISQTVIAPNTWYLVTVAVASDRAQLYINGALDRDVATTPYTVPPSTQGCYFFGAGQAGTCIVPSTNTYFAGLLDDVRVYNRVLSASEVSSLYSASGVTATAVPGFSSAISALGDSITSFFSSLNSSVPQSALSAAVALSVNTLDFGSVNVGSQSAAKTITVTYTVDTTTPPPTTIKIGSRVKTTANVNVRASASTGGRKLCAQRAGSLGTVIGGPKTANGYTWWNVNFDSRCDGWSVSRYLTASLALITDEDGNPIASVDEREAQLAAAITALQSILEQIRALQGR